MINYEDFGINIPHGKTTGEIVTICPKCSHNRKKHSQKCLGVNLDLKIWRCNHCDWRGILKTTLEKKHYAKPIFSNKTHLNDKIVKWFEERKISQKTLSKMKITESVEFMPQTEKKENCINFNYFRNDELINVKFRDGAKNFKLSKDAELIFYNLDAIKDTETCYIVEGEIDALSLIEAGIDNVISVPNGANDKTNNLQYLDNCYNYFEDKKEIILFLDNDKNGRKLKYDLAERLGIDRCKYIEIEDCKDANEYLIKHGLNAIISIYSKVKYFPIEGMFTIEDIDNDIDDMYINGLEKGVSVEIEGFNLNFVKGYLTVITGIPSHGKSDFLDFLTIKLKLLHNWKGCFYSPENRPTQLHFSKMARKLTGKHWDGNNRISLEELKEVKQFLNNSFWFLKPEKNFDLQSILKQIKQLKIQYGIDFFVIDAWNKIDHKGDNTEYIGKCLDEIVDFCELNNVHCFLVAHPTKIPKKKDSSDYEVPTLYNVNGSANFYNKADNGICVYRQFGNENRQDKTYIHIQKIKFDHWGTEGMCEFEYDLVSKRYYANGDLDRTNWINKERNYINTLYDEMKEYVDLKKNTQKEFDIF